MGLLGTSALLCYSPNGVRNMSRSLRFLQGFLFIIVTAGAQLPPFLQQGPKLLGVGGNAVGLSADGNTAVIGSPNDGGGAGSAGVYTRSNGVWTLQAKLIGAGAAGNASQGTGV